MSATTKTGRPPAESTIKAQAARLVAVSMTALADIAQDVKAPPADRVNAVRLLSDLAAKPKQGAANG